MEAFVRQYYAAIGQAAASGNIASIQQMIKPTCTCARLITFIKQSSKQGKITGFVYQVQGLSDPGLNGDAGTVTVEYNVSRALLTGRNGAVIASEAPEAGQTVVVTTQWVGTRWVISNVVAVPSG